MQVRLSGTPKGNVLDGGLDTILTRGSASEKVKGKSNIIYICLSHAQIIIWLHACFLVQENVL